MNKNNAAIIALGIMGLGTLSFEVYMAHTLFGLLPAIGWVVWKILLTMIGVSK